MRALVLSGGGAKGAYQVGALQYMVLKRGFKYDIITGTSVGALNASFLSMFPKADEELAVRKLYTLWKMRVENKSIRKYWYGGVLGPLPVVLPKWLGGKQSVYNTKPLQSLVHEVLDTDRVAESGRILRIGAYNLSKGNRSVWTEKDGDYLHRAVLASASFPMFMEPILIDGDLYTDDGIVEIAPVEEAIKAGATRIDVVLTGPDHLGATFKNTSNGLALGQRILDAMSLEIEKWDLKVVKLYNNLCEVDHPSAAGKRRIEMRVLQPKKLLMPDALDFSPKLAADNMLQGYLDAEALDW